MPLSAARSNGSRISAFSPGADNMSTISRSERMLHAVILRSSVAHGRIRSIDTAAARARPGVHAVITAADIGEVPTIPLRQEPLPASKRYEQPVIAVDKVRYVGEPIAVVVADSAALAEDALEAIVVDIEPLAGGGRSRCSPQGRCSSVRRDRDQSRQHHHGRARRRRCGVQGRALRPARTFPRAAACRGADGAARAPCRVGRGATAHDGDRRRQSAVHQPARAGEDDGFAGNIGAHGGIRRRRRFRRARRVLSGGFSHSVRGAAHRPPGQVDRRSAREPDGAQSRARRRMRAGNRLRRDGTILALRGHAFTDLGAYLRTNGATASRNMSQIMSGPYRIPACAHGRDPGGDQQDAVGHLSRARPVRSRISAASGCSTWRRPILASIGSNFAGAI